MTSESCIIGAGSSTQPHPLEPMHAPGTTSSTEGHKPLLATHNTTTAPSNSPPCNTISGPSSSLLQEFLSQTQTSLEFNLTLPSKDGTVARPRRDVDPRTKPNPSTSSFTSNDGLQRSTSLQEVKSWRFALQKCFLDTTIPATIQDMCEMDLLFTTLEKYEMSFEELSSSKIGKIMQHIRNLHTPVLQDDKYHFKTRAKGLAEKWTSIWSADPTHLSEDVPHSPATQQPTASTSSGDPNRINQPNVDAGASKQPVAPRIVHVPVPQSAATTPVVLPLDTSTLMLPTEPIETLIRASLDSTCQQVSSPQLPSLTLSRAISLSRPISPLQIQSRSGALEQELSRYVKIVNIAKEEVKALRSRLQDAERSLQKSREREMAHKDTIRSVIQDRTGARSITPSSSIVQTTNAPTSASVDFVTGRREGAAPERTPTELGVAPLSESTTLHLPPRHAAAGSELHSDASLHTSPLIDSEPQRRIAALEASLCKLQLNSGRLEERHREAEERAVKAERELQIERERTQKAREQMEMYIHGFGNGPNSASASRSASPAKSNFSVRKVVNGVKRGAPISPEHPPNAKRSRPSTATGNHSVSSQLSRTASGKTALSTVQVNTDEAVTAKRLSVDAEDRLRKAEGNANALRIRLQDLQQQLELSSQRVKSLEVDNATVTKEAAAHKDAISAIQSELDAAKKRASEAEEILKTTESKLDTVQRQLEQCQLDQNSLRSQIGESESQLVLARDQIKGLQEAVEHSGVRAIEAETAAAVSEQAVTEAKENLSSLQDVLKHNDQQLSRTQRDLAAAVASQEEAATARKHMEEELAEITRRLAAAETSSTTSRVERNTVLPEVAQLRQSLSVTLSRLAEAEAAAAHHRARLDRVLHSKSRKLITDEVVRGLREKAADKGKQLEEMRLKAYRDELALEEAEALHEISGEEMIIILEEAEEEYQSLERRVEATNSELLKTKDRLIEAEDRLEDLEDELSGTQESLSDIKWELSDAEHRLVDEEQRALSLADDLRAAQSELEKAKEDRAAVQILKATISSLERKLDAILGSTELESEIAPVVQTSSSDDVQQRLEVKLQSLQARIRSARDQADEAQSHLLQACRKSFLSQALTESTREEEAAVLADLEERLAAANELSASLDMKRIEADVLRVTSERLREELTSSVTLLQQTSAELARTQDHLRAAQNDAETAHHGLSVAQLQMAQVEGNLQAALTNNVGAGIESSSNTSASRQLEEVMRITRAELEEANARARASEDNLRRIWDACDAVNRNQDTVEANATAVRVIASAAIQAQQDLHAARIGRR